MRGSLSLAGMRVKSSILLQWKALGIPLLVGKVNLLNEASSLMDGTFLFNSFLSSSECVEKTEFMLHTS